MEHKFWNIVSAWNTVVEDATHPLRRHENDDFAQKVWGAEGTLEAAGVQGNLLDSLIEKEFIRSTDCDSFSHGAEGSRQMSAKVNAELAEINTRIRGLADQANLDPVVRRVLGT